MFCALLVPLLAFGVRTGPGNTFMCDSDGIGGDGIGPFLAWLPFVPFRELWHFFLGLVLLELPLVAIDIRHDFEQARGLHLTACSPLLCNFSPLVPTD